VLKRAKNRALQTRLFENRIEERKKPNLAFSALLKQEQNNLKSSTFCSSTTILEKAH
jgi:hypothetical protein